MDEPSKTREQHLEAALKKSEATGHALLESASEGIVLVDASGRITLVNAAAERMFGYDRAELLGQMLEILLPDPVRRAHAEHRAQYFGEPRVRPMGSGLDLAGRRKDGTEFPVEISLSHIDAAEGMTAMALITSRIEVMLLDAEEQNLPPQVLEDLQVLHRATQRVARIAANLRSFARQAPREHTRVDLNTVVAETLLLVKKPLEVDGILLVTSLDPSLGAIVGDAGTLQQVLLNLVTNAREAMGGRGGEIRIETGIVSERPGWVRVVVRDTGPGISPEELSKVFDPFYTTKNTGTGLGLSVSYGIIQDHHGTVDVQSVPGKGTTFVLAFPVAPDQST